MPYVNNDGTYKNHRVDIFTNAEIVNAVKQNIYLYMIYILMAFLLQYSTLKSLYSLYIYCVSNISIDILFIQYTDIFLSSVFMKIYGDRITVK